MTESFFVEGSPVPQPRLRPQVTRYGRLRVVMPHDAQAWRLRVTLTARTCRTSVERLAGPLRVELLFILPRPRSHFTARGHLSKRAPVAPVGRPDLDNLAKSTLDALNGELWADDAQVVQLSLAKQYARTRDEPIGALIRCEVIG